MLTERQGPCLWKDGSLTGNPSPEVEGGHPGLMKDENKWRAAYRETSDVLSPEGESSGQFDLWPEPCSCVCVHACTLRVKPPSVLNSVILCFIYFWEEWWQKCGSAAQPVKLPKPSKHSNFGPSNAAWWKRATNCFVMTCHNCLWSQKPRSWKEYLCKTRSKHRCAMFWSQ